MKEIMDPGSSAPTGIKFHFIDIYLNELAKVGAKEVRKYVEFSSQLMLAVECSILEDIYFLDYVCFNSSID